MELSSQGFSQSDIARVLQIEKGVISRDMAYLRHQAQERMKTHIQKTMPIEYQKGITQVLRMCWGIAGRSNDERVRLQALALIDQCNSHKMDMVTNGAIVSDALKYVNGKAEKLSAASTKSIESDFTRKKREQLTNKLVLYSKLL